MRKTLYALLLVPALALAQNGKTPPGDQAGPGPGADPARAMKRMQLARTLGLATVLDLDTEQALKLGQTMSKFDDRRHQLREQARQALDTLRGAAQGGKATGAEVDGAIAKLLDLRAQGQALDKELLQAVTQNLSPQQKAKAVMFLGAFRRHMDQRMMMRMHGRGGPGMMNGPGRMDHDHGAMMDRDEGDHWAMGRNGGPDDDGPGDGGDDL